MTVADSPASALAWYEDDSEEFLDDEEPIDQYELTATPNDFNVSTIFNFIQSGAVIIPGFQRNYVWDLKRASKLIESLIIGLPVPQVFLYEEDRNRFLVIDGQQRLMSIYYFVIQRFPKMAQRTAIRRIIDESGGLPKDLVADDKYFDKFNLKLFSRLPEQPNKFDGLNYETLGEYRTAFDLRPIRNVIVKQVAPPDDDSAVHEIFHRLNSGGVNLSSQEIRASLYHSKFFEMLARINALPQWRRFVGLDQPDLNLKDIEFILRGFSMLMDGEAYTQPMNKFLNRFSKRMKRLAVEDVSKLAALFQSFLTACGKLDDKSFRTQRNRFSVTIFESVFAAMCKPVISGAQTTVSTMSQEKITELKANERFSKAILEGSTKTANVEERLSVARAILLAP